MMVGIIVGMASHTIYYHFSLSIPKHNFTTLTVFFITQVWVIFLRQGVYYVQDMSLVFVHACGDIRRIKIDNQ